VSGGFIGIVSGSFIGIVGRSVGIVNWGGIGTGTGFLAPAVF